MTDYRKTLAQLFGSFRQEKTEAETFRLFVEPNYFPELETSTACVIVGGRGTGKTTALWGLSYEGQYALHGASSEFVEATSLIGLYYKVDRAAAHAFVGESRLEEDWAKLFDHYINLVLLELGLKLCQWLCDECDVKIDLDPSMTQELLLSLGIETAVLSSIKDLRRVIRMATVNLEFAVNNHSPIDQIGLSVLGRPLRIFYDALHSQGLLAGKTFAFLVDEYESFTAAQQRSVNTLVKGAPTSYTFKIGVRELGFHSRLVVGNAEPLVAPADYALIDLTKRLESYRFREFATRVVQTRISEFYRMAENPEEPPSLAELFPGLTTRREAELLGVESVSGPLRIALLEAANAAADTHLAAFIEGMESFELSVLRYWAESTDRDILDAAREAAGGLAKWETRIVNYGYASLFTIKAGKAAQIRKFYAGWETYLRMAAGNVRFLLQLVSAAFSEADSASVSPVLDPVSPTDQTLAAQAVGREHVFEVGQIDEVGGDLVRLTLGLGRLFETMARQPHGHTPEVNEFYLAPADVESMEQESRVKLERLIRAAVQHSVLLRLASTKRQDLLTTREDDYLLHPALSAFFVYSHRRKRKMLLKPDDLLGLLSQPKATLQGILARSDRVLGDELPDQLELFDEYYGAQPQ